MTDIDTAAIRNIYTCDPGDTPAVQDTDRTVLALCDALDAARAERDKWRAIAQSDSSTAVTRAEADEARIANALALLERGAGEPIEAVRRALTGDTT